MAGLLLGWAMMNDRQGGRTGATGTAGVDKGQDTKVDLGCAHARLRNITASLLRFLHVISLSLLSHPRKPKRCVGECVCARLKIRPHVQSAREYRDAIRILFLGDDRPGREQESED